MPTPTNQEFLQAIFGVNAPWVHVTDFTHDPNNIPADEHLRAWAGDYFSRYPMQIGSNQYFTVSLFYADDQGKARRRKALYWQTPCIVLDDVREKLSMDEVSKLPQPSWILETSPGSEQWGYILVEPVTDRSRVENLLDGLVANGLAPDGRDPGMKGVTRYVRLPDGYNTKASKMVNGLPFKCRMVSWQPFNRVTLEQLAEPFSVDLDAARREQRVDGAAAVDDHPLLHIPDIIHIKEVRSDGRFDIRCPWVDEHTGADDSGAGVFTNGDGSIGFKCHHGACQTRTGADLLRYIEGQRSGFGTQLSHWKAIKALSAFSSISFMQAPVAQPVDAGVPAPAPVHADAGVSFLGPTSIELRQAPHPDAGLNGLIDQLRRERPTTPEARELAATTLKIVEELPTIEQMYWHDHVRDLMSWSKQDLQRVLKDLRATWYLAGKKTQDFYATMMFVKEQNAFYDWSVNMFFTPEAFQNSFMDQDVEARKSALQDGMVIKVDRLDFAPKRPRIFTEDGVTYGNSWADEYTQAGCEGDASPWLNHFREVGWDGEHQKHILQFMAYTIRHPDVKINHILLLGSGEGVGKDFILYPLMRAMGRHSTTISGEELLEGFNDYLLNTKHLHINETELGDRKEAMAIGAKLKPIAAAPPERLRVNQKGIKKISVRNLLNGTMTTNSQMPLRLNGTSRRFYALWSDLNVRDENQQMRPEWERYWREAWNWMKNGGAEYCIWYLRNQVDLSDFVPGQAPKMTEFLLDIQEASKPPAQQTVEAFIRRRVGVFKSDILTASDMCSCLRVGDMVGQDIVYNDTRFFTPSKVGQILRDIPGCAKKQISKNNINSKVWIIRNLDRYQHMTSVQLYDEYERQMQYAIQTQGLTVVK